MDFVDCITAGYLTIMAFVTNGYWRLGAVFCLGTMLGWQFRKWVNTT